MLLYRVSEDKTAYGWYAGPGSRRSALVCCTQGEQVLRQSTTLKTYDAELNVLWRNYVSKRIAQT